jgi:hypothetical protein
MTLTLTRPAKTLFGIRELHGRWADISLSTIRNKIASGEIRTIRFGGRRLVPLAEVLRIDEHGLEFPAGTTQKEEKMKEVSKRKSTRERSL